MNIKQSFAAILAALIALAWAVRWDVTPVQNGGAIGGAYMLNRWTGTVYFMHRSVSREVVPYKPAATFDFDSSGAPISGSATK